MSKRRFRSFLGLVACACALTGGCAPSLEGNKPREPNKAIPGSFGPAGAKGGDKASSKNATSSAQKAWNQFFTDPHLMTLIESAFKDNKELNIRLQEIIIAKNEVMASEGEYLPKLGVGAGAGIEKVGKYTSQGASDEANGVPEHLQNYAFGFSASWEVDIWKKLRNTAKAKTFRYLASIEGRKFVVTQLVAEIANGYYELLALDNQLELLRQNIKIQQEALEVVKVQKEAARVTQLAVQRFEAEVLKNQSRQYDLEQQIVVAENRINFLVGRYPQPVARDSKKLSEPLPNVIQAGLPSELLENRPDVRAAELGLEAAKLDVQATKARFYPSLSIEADVGYQSFNAGHLVDTPESMLYNLAGNISAPLLNRQGIKADYYTANAEQLKAVFNYEQTLLQAFGDVANQLSMLKNLQQSYDLQAEQVNLLTSSIDVSNVLFLSARADYMEVLLTRRDALEAELQLIETKQQQLHAMVNVYQALGGGWK